MSMTPEIYLTMAVATSKQRSVVRLGKLMLPVGREHLANPNFREQWLRQFLTFLDVPENFFNGHDCNMITNLSRMLHDSVVQQVGVEKDYLCVIIMVFNTHCSYNVVKSSSLFHAEHVPSRAELRSLACDEGGEHSLPAGATTLGRFTVQDEDEDDNCVICFEEFNTGDDVARILPCSHVYHYNCILQWFVQKRTCPVCRFACSHASF